MAVFLRYQRFLLSTQNHEVWHFTESQNYRTAEVRRGLGDVWCSLSLKAEPVWVCSVKFLVSARAQIAKQCRYVVEEITSHLSLNLAVLLQDYSLS